MANLLRDGAVAEDAWLPPGEDANNEAGRIVTLAQWQAAGEPAGAAVQIEGGDSWEALLPRVGDLAMIAVFFPAFTDGRGFSYARKLRESGFEGELRARGELLPDQAHYLRRCGFNALEFADPARLQAAAERISVFSNDYQAAVDQPLPLFRRRA